MKKKLLLSALILASGLSNAEIRQEFGVDQSVDYRALEALGPWDDRNYQLTKEDLDILPENDQYLSNVPLFFKIQLRKENPHYGEFYPRSALQAFQINYGGLLVDGIWYKEGLGKGYHPDSKYGKPHEEENIKATPDNETSLALGVFGNEVAIECNPTNNNNCVAGSNQSGGQSMYYSTDAGATWTFSQTNASSCCDPTVDWSSDGSIVYQGDLSGGSIGVRWTRSLDQGVTWEPMKVITTGGSDKEFIHVDRSASSPHQDNVYMTWHDGNVMQFARSTDMGLTMSTPIAFNSEETGIGSDITTDPAGNVYYFYPSLGAGISPEVRLLKSTDGGVTFASGIQVAPLNGRFDFPIPAMETREVFIYTSADVDTTTGDVYVAWTDEADDSNGGGTGGATANHAWIQVAKSTDQGATWNMCAQPHDTSDTLAGTPIDRFHPWIKVGENGVVHIGYYDTRHSTSRSGVDFFYTSSVDGCATWATEERYTTETSDNIGNGQEWGDYNGLSVVLDKIAMSFTDNRPSVGQTAMIASGENPKGSATYNLAANDTSFDVCAGDTGLSTTINVSTIQGYNNDVTFSATATPSFVVGPVFGTNPVSPTPGSTTMSFDVDNSGTTNSYTLTVQGTGDEEAVRGGPVQVVRSLDFTINYSAGVAAGTTLTSPTDTETNVSAMTTFTWDADPNALTYLLEVATDDQFGNIVISEVVDTNTFQATSDLQTSTEHFWRVTAQSPCGDAMSSVFSFTTTVAPGDCPLGTNQIDLFSYDFEGPQTDPDVLFAHGFEDNQFVVPWVVSAAIGLENWSIQPVGDGGSSAYQADDINNVNDTSLISPQMTLSSGNGPLTLRFWNTQEIEDRASGCYDSATLEISVDGGPFTQVPDTDIINNAYDGPTDGGFSHPLPPGTNAWCGDPMAATVFNVDVDAYQGQNVKFAFRMTSDSSVGRPAGWAIDNVRVTGCEAP